MILTEKLFDVIEVDFPIENKLNIVIGENGTYKSHTLKLLSNYFKEIGENVVYIPDFRFFCHTKEDVEDALKKIEGINGIRRMISKEKYKHPIEKMGLNMDRVEFDNIQNKPITKGYVELLNMFVCIMKKHNPIVIIDEPERHMSLTIQSELINILLKFNLKKLIVATHSPSMIADHWDGVVNIEKCTRWLE